MSLVVHKLLLGSSAVVSRPPPTSHSEVITTTVKGATHSIIKQQQQQQQISPINPHRHVSLSYAPATYRVNSPECSSSKQPETVAGSVSYGPAKVQSSRNAVASKPGIMPSCTVGNTNKPAHSKQQSNYNLPFVLQDHNYGAPPPPSPQSSPPTSPPYAIQVHKASSPVSSRASANSQYFIQQYHHPKKNVSEQSIASVNNSTLASVHLGGVHLNSNSQHLNNNSVSSVHVNSNASVHLGTKGGVHVNTNSTSGVHSQHVTASSSTSASSCILPIPSSYSSNYASSSTSPSVLPRKVSGYSLNAPIPSASPLHSSVQSPTSPLLTYPSSLHHHHPHHRQQQQQQFLPQPPKPSMFPCPHIPPPPPAVTGAPDVTPAGGPDTDEESRLSDRSSSVGNSGEETETAPEGEGEEQVQPDDSITRCVCDFTHDDGYMIQCDHCFVWQHVDCMAIDRNNIPDEYLCEACKPRMVDKSKARSLQIRRRQEIKLHLARPSSSDSDDNVQSSKNRPGNKPQERKVLKKRKPKQNKDNNSSKNTKKPSLTPSRKSLNSSTSSSSSSVSLSSSRSPTTDEKERRCNTAKSKRRQSNPVNDSNDDKSTTSLSSSEQLKTWLHDYEVAVTNHYSPELRARIQAVRINGISADLKASTQGAVLGHRCKTIVRDLSEQHMAENKVLVAATMLLKGTAIIEYQGKYTLKSQWNNSFYSKQLHYIPFVLQYNMSKEGLSVCVDARTYGNDARFVRRASKHNAEICHVIERGSLHLYVVATETIDEDEEVVLPLDTAIVINPHLQQNFINTPSPAPRSPSPIPKTQTNSTPFKAAPPTHASSPARKNGLIQSKKLCRKMALGLSLPQPLSRSSRRTSLHDTQDEPQSTANSNNTQHSTNTPKQRRASESNSRSPSKSPCKSPLKSPGAVATKAAKSPMKSPQHGSSDEASSPSKEANSHKMTREERKIAAYMKAFERMEKAAQRRQEIDKKKEEEKGKDDNEDDREKGSSADETTEDKNKKKGKRMRNRSSPQKRINSNSEMSPNKSGINNGNNNQDTQNFIIESETDKLMPQLGLVSPSSDRMTASAPVVSANNTGFRFPKTKKALMNEWLSETVDPVLHSPTSYYGDPGSGVPVCYMRSPARKQTLLSNTACAIQNLAADVSAGCSAKKRWLRQAISEETDPHKLPLTCSSPNSRPDSPVGCSDYITPLKKRRLARESLSSEQSNTPPSTPHYNGNEDAMQEELALHTLHKSDIKNEPFIKKLNDSREVWPTDRLESLVKREIKEEQICPLVCDNEYEVKEERKDKEERGAPFPESIDETKDVMCVNLASLLKANVKPLKEECSEDKSSDVKGKLVEKKANDKTKSAIQGKIAQNNKKLKVMKNIKAKKRAKKKKEYCV